MSKLESARRTGFNGLRSKSGEWIVIKNKKKKNWQKIENNKPMMLHQSSSSEEFEGGIEENNDEGDGYRAGEEGDDEIDNEDLQGEEEEEDDSVKRKPGAPHRSIMKFSSKSTSNLHTHGPRPHAGAQPIPGPSSAPLLPFPPGFVPRPSPSFKSTQATLTPNPISNRPVSQQTSPKQTEKISTTTGFCRYFLQGYCRDGKRCVFSHDASTLKRTQSDPQEYDDPLITNDDHPSNNNSHPSPLVGRPIYRSHSSDMSSHSLTHHTHHHNNNQRPNQHHHNHIHNHDHDHSTSSSPLDFQLESITVSSPLNHPLDLPHRRNNNNLPPSFVSPTTSIMSETGSEVSSRSAMSNLFSSSTSPFTLLPSTPSIPVPFPSLSSTYSASNPTSPFASSLSPDTLGGLNAFRLNTSYSHSNSKSLSGKAISRSLSRPSNGIDSTTSENNSPYESSRSRSLTSESTTSPSSSFSLGWSSFPRSAPSHFYTYDTPLAAPSSSPHLGSSILAQLTSGTPGPSVSALLSKKSSVESSPLMSSMGVPTVQSGSRMHTPHLGPVEDVPMKLEEEELDEKHADLDLKLVELALSDGPESILLDQHSNEDPESIPENNSSPIPENTTTTIQSILAQSNHGNNNNSSDGVISVEFPNVSPSVSPFDPTDLNLNLSSIGVGITLNNNNQESIINESLSVNLSSGEESPSDSPSSPHHQNQQSADEQDQDQDELLDSSSMLTTSKPIPIPGSSPASYSSIVRASTSPVLTSAPAPMTKKSNAALKKEKDDVKAILPVAALSDKKGRKVCSFFLQGICRYGQQCRHRHLHCVSDKCLSCGLTCGSTQEEQQQHLQTCTEVVAMEKERRESGSRKCGICHQLTLKLNRKFGLLISCNHSFCLQCIREWRGSSEHSRERVRACPICKVVSHYVIPCDRHVAEPSRKQRVIVEYKWRLGQIDCKHYNRGKSVCPFGEACFYRHEDSSSPKSKAKRGPKTYNEGIFDDDDEEEEEGDLEEEEEVVPQVVNNNNNHHHQRDGHNKNQNQSSTTSREGGRSVPLLKFAKKQKSTTGPSIIPTTSSSSASMHVKTKNNHVKKNNNNNNNNINGKYVKGKSQKKK